MPDFDCRLAKLEQRQETMDKTMSEMKDDNRRRMDKVFDLLDELCQKQEKQKGFVGGVVFTVGALFTALTWFFTNKP